MILKYKFGRKQKTVTNRAGAVADKKGLFLDRDGIINVDNGYVHREEDFFCYPEIFPICKKFLDKGYTIVVVTNQSGIQRGYFTEEDFENITKHMLGIFERNGIHIPRENIYHCPYLDATQPCRKPNPGMILESASQLGINVAKSVIIGDSNRDIEAGVAAGVGTRVKIGVEGCSDATHHFVSMGDLLSGVNAGALRIR